MGIILGALAGAGKAAGEVADANTKLWGQQELETQRAKLEEGKQIAIEKAKNEMADANRSKMVSAIDRGTRGIIKGRLDATNPVEDQSTWTPEQEAARNQGIVGMAVNDPRARVQAAANAGYLKEAGEMDKINEGGSKIVPWGSAMVDAEGKPIYDNGSALKGSIGQQKADAKAAGGTKKVDHFDEKQWDSGFGKMDKSAVTLTNAMGEAEKSTHPELKNIWRTTYNSIRNTGELGPDEAVSEADDVANMVKRKAEQRVAIALTDDKKSTLTVDKAIQDIVKEKQAAERKMGQQQTQPPAIAPAKPQPKVDPKPEAKPAEKTPEPPKRESKSTIPGAPARDEGESAFESTIKLALARVGFGTDTPEYTKYLKDKIRLHQPLTASETAQAKKLNLL